MPFAQFPWIDTEEPKSPVLQRCDSLNCVMVKEIAAYSIAGMYDLWRKKIPPLERGGQGGFSRDQERETR